MTKAKKTKARKTQTVKRSDITKAELMERKERLKREAWAHCPCNRPETEPAWYALNTMMDKYPSLFSKSEAHVIMRRVRAMRENLND